MATETRAKKTGSDDEYEQLFADWVYYIPAVILIFALIPLLVVWDNCDHREPVGDAQQRRPGVPVRVAHTIRCWGRC